ncbi:MAG: 3-isopropylmalate dehydratase small subunit [Candidatus Sumerlaeota bacterium]|nr:3-isopropylmalate dehydratase small subunit [Candidatus Sumerlaeota bacterium]
MDKSISGRAWVFGDDVNTDIIYPGKYTYEKLSPAEMAKHAMEDAEPGFAGKVRKGDVIVAGKNFGCGSSREQAAACLKAAGISAVIAKSFARIYFRNAINLGLPVVQCAVAVEAIKPGDEVTVDFTAGVILHGGQTYAFPPLPDSVMSILEKGGLVEHVKASLARKS